MLPCHPRRSALDGTGSNVPTGLGFRGRFSQGTGRGCQTPQPCVGSKQGDGVGLNVRGGDGPYCIAGGKRREDLHFQFCLFSRVIGHGPRDLCLALREFYSPALQQLWRFLDQLVLLTSRERRVIRILEHAVGVWGGVCYSLCGLGK